MKGDYVKEKQDHRNTTTMLAKLHQTQNFHPPPPPPPPQTTFHHPFHINNRECQTSEEADSHSHRSPTTTKKEQHPSSTTHDGATIEVIRRPRGRPPGSKNKPRPPIVITRDTDQPSMNPYVLELPSGVDIVDAVTRFCRKRNIGLSILNGSGAVCNVTLRQPSSTPGATVIFHGRFDILSISATILASNTQITQVFANGNGFTILLAGPQGQVFGGSVVGTLTSATTVYLIAATFNTPSYHRLPFEDDEVRNAASAGVSGGGGNDGSQHQSPPQVSGGGGDGGMGVYGRQMASDVIWTPPSRQQPPY